MRVPAVVLAGGRASRMGGGDKGLMLLGGLPILAHVLARLGPQAGPVALNAGGDPARFAAYGLPVLPDPVPGQPGPLAGVLAALDWAAGLGAEQVLTVPWDTPFLPHDLARHLAGPAPALAATPAGLHPTCALWPVALRDDLRAALAAGQHRVADWALSHHARRVEFPATPFDPFFNINRPGDLAHAESLLSSALSKYPGGPGVEPPALSTAAAPPVWGITGWKNAGKTTLTERLVAHFTARGLRVSTVKHAHHDTDIDQPGRDSHRHRQAGAGQVVLSTPHRWALMTELRGTPEPALADLLSRLDPCDLVLVEGFKADPHPKIEVHRTVLGRGLMAPGNPWVRAVASDRAIEAPVPVLGLDDVAGLAGFIAAELGL